MIAVAALTLRRSRCHYPSSTALLSDHQVRIFSWRFAGLGDDDDDDDASRRHGNRQERQFCAAAAAAAAKGRGRKTRKSSKTKEGKPKSRLESLRETLERERQEAAARSKEKNAQQSSSSQQPAAAVAVPNKKQKSDEKFPLPDKDREMELAQIQNEVNDLYKAGNYKGARETLERDLLPALNAHFGEAHPATASAYNNLALFCKQLGDFDASRKHYNQAMKVYKQTVGADHASYASCLHNLGTMNRLQCHLDDRLSPLERLTLIEESCEYLEQAHRIRVAELGEQHPHAVASRSSWGQSLTAHILHHYKQVPINNKDSSSSKDDDDDATAETEQFSYIAATTNTSLISEEGWNAAEEHLRLALWTAIEHPRGPSLDKSKKKKKQQPRQQPGALLQQQEPPGLNETLDEAWIAQMQTLSAASAGQNLAIFFKARAAVSHDDAQQQVRSNRLEQSKLLYERVLKVRTQLLPATHPDMYATKHSYAEVLQALDQTEQAQTIRQEIVDTWDEPGDEEKEVVVEKTSSAAVRDDEKT